MCLSCCSQRLSWVKITYLQLCTRDNYTARISHSAFVAVQVYVLTVSHRWGATERIVVLSIQSSLEPLIIRLWTTLKWPRYLTQEESRAQLKSTRNVHSLEFCLSVACRNSFACPGHAWTVIILPVLSMHEQLEFCLSWACINRILPVLSMNEQLELCLAWACMNDILPVQSMYEQLEFCLSWACINS